MSKSTGNFLTLADAIEKYSADGKIRNVWLHFSTLRLYQHHLYGWLETDLTVAYDFWTRLPNARIVLPINYFPLTGYFFLRVPYKYQVFTFGIDKSSVEC